MDRVPQSDGFQKEVLVSKKVAIVLAMHGTPPKDFPKKEMAELFELRAHLRHHEKGTPTLKKGASSLETAARHEILDAKMRQWPRSEKNDLFYMGSNALGQELSRTTGLPVIVGFNEFCDPTLDMAIDRAFASAVEKVVVTTPMMTRGGEHSKTDIPAAIARGQTRHPQAEIVYAWPFPLPDIATFLAAQIASYLS